MFAASSSDESTSLGSTPRYVDEAEGPHVDEEAEGVIEGVEEEDVEPPAEDTVLVPPERSAVSDQEKLAKHAALRGKKATAGLRKEDAGMFESSADHVRAPRVLVSVLVRERGSDATLACRPSIAYTRRSPRMVYNSGTVLAAGHR